MKKKRKSDLMIELLGVTFHRGQKVMSLKNSGSAKRKKSKKQQHQRSFKTVGWAFPGGPGVGASPRKAGDDVRALAGKLRSHVPQGQRPKPKTETIL